MIVGTFPRLAGGALALLAVSAVPAVADELYVPAQYPTIQAAIDAAQDADIIWVAPGVYFETFDSLGKRVDVRSEAGPELTILDGGGAGPIAIFHSSNGSGTALRGFTLRHARLTDPTVAGAAVQIRDTDFGPTLEGNIFEQNEAQIGAAIGCTDQAFLRLENNIFRHNRAHVEGAALWMNRTTLFATGNRIEENRGTAIYSDQSEGILCDNVLRANRGAERGGAFRAELFESWTIENNRFEDNEALESGGAIHIGPAFVGRIARNDFIGNSALEGGAIAVDTTGTTFLDISRNRILDNTAARGGGIFYRTVNGSLGAQLFSDNLLAGNRADAGEQAWFCACEVIDIQVLRNTFVQRDASSASTVHLQTQTFGDIEFSSNIVQTAEGGVGVHCQFHAGSDISLRHNCVWASGGLAWSGDCTDPTGTLGNIAVEPGFMDAAQGDYRLHRDSPCIDAGDPENFWLGYDPDGNVWPQDGDFDGSFLVDIGAYEFHHVRLEVEGEPVLGEPLTLRARGTKGLNALLVVGRAGFTTGVVPPYGPLFQRLDERLVIIAVGTLPMEHTWVLDEEASWQLTYAVQALVRGPVPGTGNSSNPYVFKPIQPD